MNAKALLLLTGFLAGVILTAAINPLADDDFDATFDVGAGECDYTPAPNGQWRQDEFPTTIRTHDKCHSYGFSLQRKDWTLGIHYATLGSVAIDSHAVTCPKDDCNNTRDFSKDFGRAECKPGFKEDNCAYDWRSGGNAKGVLGSAAYRAFNMGALGFDLRGGLYFHQLKYAAVVENIGCNDNPACWRMAVTQKSRYAIAPVLGVGVKYEPGFLRGGFVGVTWDRFFRIGEHVEVTAGFKGPTDRMMAWVGVPL